MIIINVLKVLIRTIFVFRKIQWSRLFKKYRRESKFIVLVYPNYPKDLLRYFYSDAFVNDMALLSAVSVVYPHYSLKIGARKMNRVFDSHVFINLNSRYNFHQFRNYSASLVNFILGLEDQNNKVFPSSQEALFWENKLYMHNKFSELNIKSPYTEFWNLDNLNIEFNAKKFPFLIKEIHSAGSNGVYKVNSKEELAKIVVNHEVRMGNKFLLAQDLLVMDRDLRVVIIGEEIVLFYWRINKGKEWKPTSTKHGSEVDFKNFPEMWRDHILNEFFKLGVTTGAFDLVWQHNDLNNAPFVLEVSTSYQPNPIPPRNLKKSYGKYKAGVSINGWDKGLVDIVFDFKKKLVECYFIR
jgi:glutathione synthase/RimK-type ligase-like ATP-grasp enzyme